MNRRRFAASAALAVAAGALARTISAKPSPHLRLPTAPQERIAVATYPFRAVIDAPGNADRIAARRGMQLPDFARYVRDTFHVSAIEPLHSHFPATTPQAVAALRKSLDSIHVRVANIPVDAATDLCSSDAGVRAQGLATYRRWIDIAVALGAPSIRIGSVPRCTDPADVRAAAQALQPVVDYGATRGIVILLENDDPVVGNATRLTGILRAAQTPWLRGLPDFANALMSGDERFNTDAVRAMFAYASTVTHVKDGETIHGKDIHVSLPPLFAIAKQAGFRGFYSIESDDSSDPAGSTRRLIQQTLALM